MCQGLRFCRSTFLPVNIAWVAACCKRNSSEEATLVFTRDYLLIKSSSYFVTKRFDKHQATEFRLVEESEISYMNSPWSTVHWKFYLVSFLHGTSFQWCILFWFGPNCLLHTLVGWRAKVPLLLLKPQKALGKAAVYLWFLTDKFWWNVVQSKLQKWNLLAWHNQSEINCND